MFRTVRRVFTLLFVLLTAGALVAPVASARKVRIKKKQRKVSRKKANTRSNVELEFRALKVTRVDGPTLRLQASLFKPGRVADERVVIRYVEGSKKTDLWTGTAKAEGTQSGFSNSISVNLRGHDTKKGYLEGVLLSCENEAKCHRRLRLRKGDLTLAGRPQIERRGTNSVMTLTVNNAGPNKVNRCKIKLIVDGRVAKEFRVSNMAVGAEQKLEYRYSNREKGKAYEAKIDCADLARGNNWKRGKLK